MSHHRGKRKRFTIRYPEDLGTPLNRQQEEADTKPAKYVETVPSFLAGLLTEEPREVCVKGKNHLVYDLGEIGAWNDRSEPKALFVRDCYNDIFAFVDSEELRKEGGPNRAVVSGTAGIGKSLFGLYVARKWFDGGRLVALWHGPSLWLFSKEQGHESQKRVTINGQTFWFLKSENSTDESKLGFIAETSESFVIRDPGTTKKVDVLQIPDFTLYNISTGNKDFFWQLQNVPVSMLLFVRYMPLWDGVELAIAHANDIMRVQTGLPWIMEGFRRYGGSARTVIAFASQSSLLGKLSEEDVETVTDDQRVIDAFDFIANKKKLRDHEAAKARALVFHRTPSSDYQTYKVHFASAYIARKIMSLFNLQINEDLAVLVAALSADGSKQDAYGALYENEVHKLLCGEPRTVVGSFLGSHVNKVKGRTPKQNVTISFNSLVALNFPGKSLENFSFEDRAEIEKTYILPVCTGFTTHDSFVLMKASVFFDEEVASGALVLVGLQMTVSGNSEPKVNPDHDVVSVHLSDHYKAAVSLVSAIAPDVVLIEDVVTIFITPSETHRKLTFRPVLTQKRTALTTAIQGLKGMAPQYKVIIEDPCLSRAMSNDVEAALS